MGPSFVDGANRELCIVIVHFEMLRSGIRYVRSLQVPTTQRRRSPNRVSRSIRESATT